MDIIHYFHVCIHSSRVYKISMHFLGMQQLNYPLYAHSRFYLRISCLYIVFFIPNTTTITIIFIERSVFCCVNQILSYNCGDYSLKSGRTTMVDKALLKRFIIIAFIELESNPITHVLKHKHEHTRAHTHILWFFLNIIFLNIIL